MRPPLRSLIGPRGLCSCWLPFFAPRSRLGGAGGPKFAERSRPPGPPPGRGPPNPPPPPKPPGRGPPKPPPPGRGPPKPPPPSEPTAGWARSAEAAAPTWTRSAEPARTRRAWRTILAGARLAHREVAALERLLIEPLDDVFRHRAFGEFDERKPARASGLAIDRHHHVGRLCNGREVSPEIRFAGAVRQITDEQTDCQGSLVKNAPSCRRPLILSQKGQREGSRLAAKLAYVVDIRRSNAASKASPRPISCSNATIAGAPACSMRARTAAPLCA